MSSTTVRTRVTHQLTLGVTHDEKTNHKYVNCTYPTGEVVYGPDAENTPHPDIRLSVSMKDDVV